MKLADQFDMFTKNPAVQYQISDSIPSPQLDILNRSNLGSISIGASRSVSMPSLTPRKLALCRKSSNRRSFKTFSSDARKHEPPSNRIEIISVDSFMTIKEEDNPTLSPVRNQLSIEPCLVERQEWFARPYIKDAVEEISLHNMSFEVYHSAVVAVDLNQDSQITQGEPHHDHDFSIEVSSHTSQIQSPPVNSSLTTTHLLADTSYRLYDLEKIEKHQKVLEKRKANNQADKLNKKPFQRPDKFCYMSNFPRLRPSLPQMPARFSAFLKLRPSLGEAWIWQDGQPTAKVLADGYHDLAYESIINKYSAIFQN